MGDIQKDLVHLEDGSLAFWKLYVATSLFHGMQLIPTTAVSPLVEANSAMYDCVRPCPDAKREVRCGFLRRSSTRSGFIYMLQVGRGDMYL